MVPSPFPSPGVSGEGDPFLCQAPGVPTDRGHCPVWGRHAVMIAFHTQPRASRCPGSFPEGLPMSQPTEHIPAWAGVRGQGTTRSRGR